MISFLCVRFTEFCSNHNSNSVEFLRYDLLTQSDPDHILDSLLNFRVSLDKFVSLPVNEVNKVFFILKFLKMIFVFSIIACLQCSVNFLLYSKVAQSYIHIYILFLTLSAIMLHHKWLDIVPSAVQQDFMAYPFQRQ